jgi:RNA polymerase sigma-70 factor (ECF subfamily)
LQRLGVRADRLHDAVQDVFLVVHRKLSGFEGRSSVKTWLYGIVQRVASDHRRTIRRKDGMATSTRPEILELVPDRAGLSPQERAERAEAIELLQELLEHIGESRREIFVLAELEEMTGPEIAEALGVEVSTVHSRLHVARAEFEQAAARSRAERRGSHDAQ